MKRELGDCESNSQGSKYPNSVGTQFFDLIL